MHPFKYCYWTINKRRRGNTHIVVVHQKKYRDARCMLHSALSRALVTNSSTTLWFKQSSVWEQLIVNNAFVWKIIFFFRFLYVSLACFVSLMKNAHIKRCVNYETIKTVQQFEKKTRRRRKGGMKSLLINATK